MKPEKFNDTIDGDAVDGDGADGDDVGGDYVGGDYVGGDYVGGDYVGGTLRVNSAFPKHIRPKPPGPRLSLKPIRLELLEYHICWEGGVKRRIQETQ